MISWNLSVLMERYRVSGNDLSAKLGISRNAVSSLRNARSMPRIDGDRLDSIIAALNELADPEEIKLRGVIKLTDLLEHFPKA